MQDLYHRFLKTFKCFFIFLNGSYGLLLVYAQRMQYFPTIHRFLEIRRHPTETKKVVVLKNCFHMHAIWNHGSIYSSLYLFFKKIFIYQKSSDFSYHKFISDMHGNKPSKFPSCTLSVSSAIKNQKYYNRKKQASIKIIFILSMML